MINFPELPESEYGLAFYDEGGMHETNGQGYTDEQMKAFALAYGEIVRAECARIAQARYMGDNNREDMEARRIAEAIKAIPLE